jgi:hypothetical protein
MREPILAERCAGSRLYDTSKARYNFGDGATA